jgi:serine/threonine protein kinase
VPSAPSLQQWRSGVPDSEGQTTHPDQARSERSAIGRLFAGRYRLGSQIGSGGLATVFEARDDILHRDVAVKILREPFAADPVFLERFSREAAHVSNLSHPGLVTVFDAGVDEGTAYIVMERIHGQTLREILATEGPLRVDRAVKIAAAVCDVLAVAHRAGIVHRDIKPGNIMIQKDGRVRVLDFGIARSEGADPLTQTATMIGTAAYISPEQAIGGSSSPRSDLYSVGCVLFEMLVGAPLFAAENPVGLLYQHAHEVALVPSTVRPEIPAAVDDVVKSLLAKDPAQRPSTAEQASAELLVALRGYTSDTQVIPIAPMPSTTQVMPTLVIRKNPPDLSAQRRRRLRRIALVALGCLAILLVWLASRQVSSRSVAGPGNPTTSPTAGSAQSAAPTPSAATSFAAPTPSAISVPIATSATTAVAAMQSVIDQGAAAGLISQTAASQLTALLADLGNTLGKGNRHTAVSRFKDLTDQVANLTASGDITGAAITAVDQALAQLAPYINLHD